MDFQGSTDEFGSIFETLSGEEERNSDEQDWGIIPVPTLYQSKISPAAKRLKTESAPIREQRGTEHFPMKSRYGHERTIIQIDIDCFYAQVEMIRHPAYRELPLGVQQKSIVVTCNYVARKRGLKKLMLVSEARKKCPDLVLVNGEDLSHYREFSSRVTSLLVERFTPHVERLGLDENFLDVSELVTSRLKKLDSENLVICGYLYDQNVDAKVSNCSTFCSCGCHTRLTMGSVLAAEIRQAILEEVGLTCCAGIAHSKLLAKLVGGCHKPNMQTTLFPEYAGKFVSSLQARELPGIGHSSAKKLSNLGINSVTELQSFPVQILEAEFGKSFANTMRELCFGIDDSDVKPSDGPKSISDEDSFQKCSTLDDSKERLKALIRNLLSRLSGDLGVPQTVRLTIRRHSTQSYRRESRQCSLPYKFIAADKEQRADILLAIALELLHKLVDVHKPFHLTLMNVCLTNFRRTGSGEGKAITSFFKTRSSAPSPYAKTPTPRSPDVSRPCEDSTSSEWEGLDVEKGKPVSRGSPENREFRRTFFSNKQASANGYDSLALKQDKDKICCKAEESVCLPKDVDPSVFAALPSNIQSELQRHWHHNYLNTSPHHHNRNVKKPSSLLSYFSKV